VRWAAAMDTAVKARSWRITPARPACVSGEPCWPGLADDVCAPPRLDGAPANCTGQGNWRASGARNQGAAAGANKRFPEQLQMARDLVRSLPPRRNCSFDAGRTFEVRRAPGPFASKGSRRNGIDARSQWAASVAASCACPPIDGLCGWPGGASPAKERATKNT